MRTLQSNGGAAAPELAPWFHNLHLPGGRQTAPDHPLGDFPRWKWKQIAPHLPRDLEGARALDIGCNAGFYTFELAKRGASVLAIDHDPHYLAQARWACERFGLGKTIEFREMGVYDLDTVEETFDLVLFMGVLYHLRHPLLALDMVAEKVRGTLGLQTLTMNSDEPLETPDDLTLDERELLRHPGWPVMAFVEKKMAGDPTNWWVPNAAAVEAMLRSCGMRIVAKPGHELWVCEAAAR